VISFEFCHQLLSNKGQDIIKALVVIKPLQADLPFYPYEQKQYLVIVHFWGDSFLSK
jgi:hypothetical protein